MPLTIVLLLSIIGGLNTTYAGVHNSVSVVRAIHHHTTKPVFTHVLRPAGNAIKKAAQ